MQIEDIPDEDLVYRRVHKKLFSFPQPAYSVIFNVNNPGMSTDWSKYSSPKETRNRAEMSTPEDNGVISLQTGEVRNINKLLVNYSPTKKNRAHSIIIGKRTEEIVIALSRIYKWEIKTSNVS